MCLDIRKFIFNTPTPGVETSAQYPGVKVRSQASNAKSTVFETMCVCSNSQTRMLFDFAQTFVRTSKSREVRAQ